MIYRGWRGGPHAGRGEERLHAPAYRAAGLCQGHKLTGCALWYVALTFCYLSELIVRIEEATVTLFPLPTLAPPTPLIKAKAAFSFAVHTCIQHTEPEAKPYVLTTGVGSPSTKPKPIPALVTQLLVGCRRKVVIYTWRDGEAQDVKVRLFHTVHT